MASKVNYSIAEVQAYLFAQHRLSQEVKDRLKTAIDQGDERLARRVEHSTRYARNCDNIRWEQFLDDVDFGLTNAEELAQHSGLPKDFALKMLENVDAIPEELFERLPPKDWPIEYVLNTGKHKTLTDVFKTMPSEVNSIDEKLTSHLIEECQYDEADVILRQWLSSPQLDDVECGILLVLLGEVHRRRGDLKSAELMLLKAIALVPGSDPRSVFWQSTLCNSMGMLLNSTERFEGAINFLQQGYERTWDQNQIVEGGIEFGCIAQNLATSYFYLEDFESAHQMAQIAVKWFEHKGVPGHPFNLFAGNSLFQCGIRLGHEGLSEAIEKFHAAIDFSQYDSITAARIQTMILTTLGHALCEERQFEAAAKTFQNVAKIGVAIEEFPAKAKAILLNNFGATLLDLSRFDEAKRILALAVELADGEIPDVVMKNIRNAEAKVAEGIRDFAALAA